MKLREYIPADMVKINYGLSKESWDKLQKAYQDHLDNHPVCEFCKSRPSVRITPLGPIKAICTECLDQQIKEMQQSYNDWRENEDTVY